MMVTTSTRLVAVFRKRLSARLVLRLSRAAGNAEALSHPAFDGRLALLLLVLRRDGRSCRRRLNVGPGIARLLVGNLFACRLVTVVNFFLIFLNLNFHGSINL
jgi:hypothetical protein